MLDRQPPNLLAKSCADPNHPPSAARYTAHTVAVVSAAQVLLAERGLASLDAAGLPHSLLERLSRLVLVGALIHDLGKANAHFQAMVRRTGTGQLVRHEALSVWLVWNQPLRSWLKDALPDPEDLPLALAVAAGHHRKFPDHSIDTLPGLGDRVRIFSGHADVRKLLAYGAKVLGLGRPPVLADCDFVIRRRSGDQKAFEELEAATIARLTAERTAQALLPLAKALVLNADVAGSALPHVNERTGWIARQLSQRATTSVVGQVVKRRLTGEPLRPFQKAVAGSAAPLALVAAACGNGKTVAAYAWFHQQHVGRQLWITYPTTGTALEGFRGYLRGIDGLAVDLESSRRDLDLELCGVSEASDEDAALRDAHRVESLRAWGKDAIACTVDTVLGLMQNQRKGLYAWAGLAHSAVVFDEIHAYDERLFGSLLQFLRRLPGIPALLMTASLPKERKEALERLSQECHHRPLEVFTGDPELELFPRYQFVDVDPWRLVKETLDDNGKVLWVSNTVDRCRETANQAERAGLKPLVYHSRFKYIDRSARHESIIEGFRSKGPCLAMTTQVAEMSLDLSADVLVTDVAPVSALIQRLGRLNRRSSPDHPNGIKPAVVLPTSDPKPYEPHQLKGVSDWLQALSQRGQCSQRDLVDEWEPPTTRSRPIASAWFDGGFTTEPSQVRDASVGITVLMEEDLRVVQSDPSNAMALALPMPPPKGSGWLQWPRHRRGYLPVALRGTIRYDATRGGQWAS